MLYYQGFTLSKTQEAENMSKKTVPIAVQRTQKRKVSITSNGKDISADIPVQMCHFHQKQIITRYLTNNPKLEAGIELKKLTKVLCEANEEDFTTALDDWHNRWSSFIRERTTDPSTGRWHYTHKRLRSAYRSLRLNLPYLFTHEKHPERNIPNTTLS